MADEHLEELRIALVMNGGVSLAVWMGGVTNEIFRLVKERHPVYAALLDLTHSTARVDVISGTSAGGINGAALALALIYRSEFSSLRQVWMEIGAFDELLRPPLGDNPGSLLRGDDYFLPHIKDAFSKLAHIGESDVPPMESPESMPIDLRMTTTLLEGRLACTVDDLGTPVGDRDHRARFHFLHGEKNHFENRQLLVDRLSRAARSTASFPFAFEPSKVPVYKDPNEPGGIFDVTDKPIEGAHYVVDGGILDNKPFHGALQSIFQMRTQRSVRRVLAYINPDPGTDAQLSPRGIPVTNADANPDLVSDPALASVLVSSLFAIPQAQTIVDQLNDIQTHNNRVRSRHHRVVDLVQQLTPYDPADPCDTPDTPETGPRAEPESLAANLFKLYRRRRFAYAFDNFAYQVLPAVAINDAKLLQAVAFMGKNASKSISLKFERFSCHAWYPKRWLFPIEDETYSNSGEWTWGIYPVDFAAKITLNLLRLTQRLADIAAVPEHAVERMERRAAESRPSVVDRSWADPDYSSELPRPHVETGNQDVQLLWKNAYDAIRDLNKLHDEERDMWTDRIKQLVPAGDQQIEPPTDRQLEKLFAGVDVPNWSSRCAGIMYRFADIIRELCPISRRAVANVAGHKISDGDRDQINSVNALVNYFAPRDEPVNQPGPIAVDDDKPIVRCLLRLEVINFALHDRSELEDDQLIELVQISGNSESPLGGRTRAKDKLLGLQLAHFAAFYKSSWRANDWTYGRLDGAERLVKVLLNPERLLRVFRNSDAAFNAIRRIAVDDVPSKDLRDMLASEWATNFQADVLHELAFLDAPDGRLPDQLVRCAAAITMRLHYGILEEEIRHIYNAIIDDQSKGADTSGAGEACAERLALGRPIKRKVHIPQPDMPVDPRTAFSLTQAQGVLVDGLIGGERLIDEAGTDQFTRTLAHALASLQSTLSNKQTKLGPISALFASLRVPILGFYFVAKGLTRQNRTSAAMNASVLAIGAIIIAIQLMLTIPKGSGADPLPGTIVTIGWALLAYGVMLAALSGPRIMLIECVGVAIALFVGALVLKASSVLIALMVLFGLMLSVRLLWLQWPLGFVMIVLAAVWSSSADTRTRIVETCEEQGIFAMKCWETIGREPHVVPFTVIIVLALLAAIWLSCATRKNLESRLREADRQRRIKRNVRRKK